MLVFKGPIVEVRKRTYRAAVGSNPPHAAGWTAERVEQLRNLWGAGLSALQCARELGGGVTRNAVISKVHRIRLDARPKNRAPARDKLASSPRRPAPVRVSGQFRSPAPSVAALPPAPPPVEEITLPPSERVSIIDLRETHCRWPLGEVGRPDFGYCGGDAPVGEGPYCKVHARIAYTAGGRQWTEAEKEAKRRATAAGRRFMVTA